MKYRCPVCCYAELSRPPRDDTICPCCGTHFGYHDYAISHDELRRRWISAGANWFSKVRPHPENWNAAKQLREAGFDIQPTALDATKTSK